MASAHKVDIGGLLAGNRQRLVLDEQVPLEPFEGVTFPERATVHLELQAAGDLLEISGRVDAKIQSACARCLGDVRSDMHLEVNEQVEAGSKLQGNPFEDSNVLAGERLDVAELTAQLVCSAIPIGLLCKEDCKGICPRCGENKNTAKCECNGDS